MYALIFLMLYIALFFFWKAHKVQSMSSSKYLRLQQQVKNNTAKKQDIADFLD